MTITFGTVEDLPPESLGALSYSPNKEQSKVLRNGEIRKKISEIGRKRSEETNHHIEVMEKLNDELAKVQKECEHEWNNDGHCNICGAIIEVK